jgi:hypothetical protein
MRKDMTTNVLEHTLTEWRFSLYDITVTVTTSSPHIAGPVYELLKHFQHSAVSGNTDLVLTVHAVEKRAEIPLTLSPTAVQMASGSGAATGERPATGLSFQVWKDGGHLIVDFHQAGMFLIETEQGRAVGYLVNPVTLTPNLIEYLFHTALIELLRHRRLYTIHATALEMHGLGVLIPGNSGGGKTTSFVSLLRSGYRYLSDDYPLIQDVGAHVEVLPFPMMVKVTDTTAAFFPELRDAPDHVFRPGVGKRLFHAEEIFPTSIGQRCRPAVVLFPNVVDSPHSHLELLPKSRAIEALLPQTLLVYDRAAASRQFQVLAKLVQQVDCYRLHFGRNVLDLPNLITPLLEKKQN